MPSLCIKLEVTFSFVTTACVNFSQPSVPPVTLIYLGARRTGILATEADIPTLFVLSHNVCARARVYVCSMCASDAPCAYECTHTGGRLCMHERHQKLAVRMQSNASVPPVMALPLLACEREKKQLTQCPALLPMAIIMLSDKA